MMIFILYCFYIKKIDKTIKVEIIYSLLDKELMQE